MDIQLVETLKLIINRYGNRRVGSVFISMKDFPWYHERDGQLTKLKEAGLIAKPFYYDDGAEITLTQKGLNFFSERHWILFPNEREEFACPVCGYKALVVQTDAARSWAEIECINCLTYAMRADALENVITPDLSLLAGYYRHAWHEPLTIGVDSKDMVRDHIEQARKIVTREYQMKLLLSRYYQRMNRFGQYVNMTKLPAVAYARDEADLMEIAREAVDKGYALLNEDQITVTRAGKEFIDMTEEPKPRVFKIFISHKSEDVEYAKAVVEFLEDLHIPSEKIVCTSVPGHMIPNGEKIYDWLRKQFTDYDLHVLLLLSHVYYTSPACLNEMGAAWVLQSKSDIVLLPGFKPEDIKGSIGSDTMGIYCDGKEEELRDRFRQLRDTVCDEFSIIKPDEARWETVRDRLIRALRQNRESETEGHIEANAAPPMSTAPKLIIKLVAMGGGLDNTIFIITNASIKLIVSIEATNLIARTGKKVRDVDYKAKIDKDVLKSGESATVQFDNTVFGDKKNGAKYEPWTEFTAIWYLKCEDEDGNDFIYRVSSYFESSGKARPGKWEVKVLTDDSGQCGEQVSWSLDDSGRLTIKGTGDPFSTDAYNHPTWYEHRERIREIVIEDGVKGIPDFAFAGYEKIEKVSLGNIEIIGQSAFEGCTRIEEITIPASIVDIKNHAFKDCVGLKNVYFAGAFPFVNSLLFSGPEKYTYVISQNPTYNPFAGIDTFDAYYDENCGASNRKYTLYGYEFEDYKNRWPDIIICSWGAKRINWVLEHPENLLQPAQGKEDTIFFKKKETVQPKPREPLYDMVTWLLDNKAHPDGPDTKYGGKISYAPSTYLIKRKMGPVGKDFIQLRLNASPFGAMLMMGNAGWTQVYDGTNKYHTDWKWQEAIKAEYLEKHG